MKSKTEQLYLSEYERLKLSRWAAYASAALEEAAERYTFGVLFDHGSLLKKLMSSAVQLEKDLQKSQDLVEVLKERVMFLEEQLDAYDSPGLTE